jgi:hypothetical protein
MSDVSRSHAQSAPLWAPAVLTGGVAAGLMQAPSLFPEHQPLHRIGVGIAVGAGATTGLAGEGIARGLDRVLPGDRLASEGVVVGVGTALAAALMIASPGRLTGNIAKVRSASLLLAAGAGAGAVSSLVAGRTDSRRQSALALAGSSALITAGVWGLSHRASVAASSTVGQVLPGVAKYETTPEMFGTLLLAPGKAVPADRPPQRVTNLTKQGIEFLTERPNKDEISLVMDREARDPFRAFVSRTDVPEMGDQQAEADAQVALALQDLETGGVFGTFRTNDDGTVEMVEPPRAAILLMGTTSTGYAHRVPSSSFEFFNGGDSAVVAIQTGTRRAEKEMHMVARATYTNEAVARAVRDRIAQIPEGIERPEVYVYGESYGALTTQNEIAGDVAETFPKKALGKGKWNGPTAYPGFGIERMDQLGIKAAFWAGSPYRSRFPEAIMSDAAYSGGSTPIAVKVRNIREIDAITEAQAQNLRMAFFNHDADPSSEFTTRLFWEDARFLGPRDQRGEGVSRQQTWFPFITGLQTLLDQEAALAHQATRLDEVGHDHGVAPIPLMRRVFHFNNASDVELARMAEWNRQLEDLRGA